MAKDMSDKRLRITDWEINDSGDHKHDLYKFEFRGNEAFDYAKMHGFLTMYFDRDGNRSANLCYSDEFDEIDIVTMLSEIQDCLLEFLTDEMEEDDELLDGDEEGIEKAYGGDDEPDDELDDEDDDAVEYVGETDEENLPYLDTLMSVFGLHRVKGDEE